MVGHEWACFLARGPAESRATQTADPEARRRGGASPTVPCIVVEGEPIGSLRRGRMTTANESKRAPGEKIAGRAARCGVVGS